MVDGLKIECPLCKKETQMIHLKHLETSEKDLERAKSNPETLVWSEMSPEQSRALYKILTLKIDKNLSSRIYQTISRITSHNLGLFKGHCTMSDKVFKVYHYLEIDHEKQIARTTFRIDEEIYNY